MVKINYIFFLMLLGFLPQCRESNGHDHDPVDHHDHETVSEVQSYTIWTDKSELFVEFEPLVVGEVTTFIAHFTEMNHFKPVMQGSVTVSLIKDSDGIRQTVDAPASPGIFKPALKPVESGVHNLLFEITTPNYSDEIIINGVEVFNDIDEAYAKVSAPEENANKITFLKEQAWKMEFANAEVEKDTVFNIIKTGGEILPALGDEQMIVATANGVLIYTQKDLTIGADINQDQSLFIISGGGISENNVQTEFIKAKSNYDLAKSNYERKKELYETKAVAKPEYEEALLNFQLAESQYNNLASNYSKGGKSVNAPVKGYIKNLIKGEGEFVSVGEPVAIITQNEKLTLRADVNQLDYGLLSNDMSANFTFNNSIYKLSDFDGSLLSYGKAVNSSNGKIPVYFELNNTGNLLPGSFIEVFIKTQAKNNGVLIPVEALLEEYGQYSVIVQSTGESFEERNIQIGVSDGEKVEVVSGLKEGERVVTKGAYQIKMAAMSGQVPAHGHSH